MGLLWSHLGLTSSINSKSPPVSPTYFFFLASELPIRLDDINTSARQALAISGECFMVFGNRNRRWLELRLWAVVTVTVNGNRGPAGSRGSALSDSPCVCWQVPLSQCLIAVLWKSTNASSGLRTNTHTHWHTHSLASHTEAATTMNDNEFWSCSWNRRRLRVGCSAAWSRNSGELNCRRRGRNVNWASPSRISV